MKLIRSALAAFGIDLRRLWLGLRGIPAYLSNLATLRRQLALNPDPNFRVSKLYPCLADRFMQSGAVTGHYFQQDLHVAQLIFRHQPRRHIDVGSRIDGLVAHVASFRHIDVQDIRPLSVDSANISFMQRDIMQPRPDLNRCTDSLSCLHALEHFGLGRYGDPVDQQGYRRAWTHLSNMLEPGGKFYFSVPIGRQRIEFDAHRVFAVPFLLEMFAPDFVIDSFAFIDDAGQFHRDVDPSAPAAQSSFGCRYGCGIFELRKR